MLVQTASANTAPPPNQHRKPDRRGNAGKGHKKQGRLRACPHGWTGRSLGLD
ncbi:hypothetical protein LX36DRAFT_650876 [Colletotrichum falcatum]|nr:hypothetical protein LX36DRAFT_650876 [Colletotrichum falcatum]